MATKKARKGAVSLARKRVFPKKGDAVWIDSHGVLGIFVGYSERDQVVTLRWPSDLFGDFWPRESKSIFDVVRSDIKVLSPVEILVMVAQLARHRDREMRDEIAKFVTARSGRALFPHL